MQKYSNIVLTRPNPSSLAFKQEVKQLGDELDKLIAQMIKDLEALGIKYDEEDVVLTEDEADEEPTAE
jgi:hypothetical protein